MAMRRPSWRTFVGLWLRWTIAPVVGFIAFGVAVGTSGALALIAAVELDVATLTAVERVVLVGGGVLVVSVDQAVQLVRRQALLLEITNKRRAIEELKQALTRSELNQDVGTTFVVWAPLRLERRLSDELRWPWFPDPFLMRSGVEMRLLTAEAAAVVEGKIAALLQEEADAEAIEDAEAIDDDPSIGPRVEGAE